MIHVIVLGSAAGGGYPQWNSNAEACRRARAGDPNALPRTQTSLAVSGDGEHWFVLNASPDIRAQIERTVALHPKHGLRSSPIVGVVLTNAEVDSIAGLLSLRESQPLTLMAHSSVQRRLGANPIFDVLSRDHVGRICLELDAETPLILPGGQHSGLTLTAFAVPGKAPLYAEGEALSEIGETVGLCITNETHRVMFVPSCASVTPDLLNWLDGADCVFFDGTLWQDDEMIRAGVGTKTGRLMGHMSASGPDGVIEAFRDVQIPRKVLIHANNSNPVLLGDSVERRFVEARGWEVAFDGMELEL